MNNKTAEIQCPTCGKSSFTDPEKAKEWQGLEEQIQKLAQFILNEVPNELSQNEGAVDTAIRIIKELQNATANQAIYIRQYQQTIKELSND